MENVINHLNAVLGYASNVFDAPVTRTHYICEKQSDSYSTYVKNRIVIDKYELTEFQQTTIDIVESGSQTTVNDICKATGVSRKFVSATLTAMYKENMIIREKVKTGNRLAYAYTGKKNDARSST